MKRIIISILMCCYAPFVLLAQSQEKRTVVSVYLPEAQQGNHKVTFFVGKKNYEVGSKDGYCKLITSLSEPSMLIVEVDDQRIIAAYYNTMFVEPGDSLNFEIRYLKQQGFAGVYCTGKGSEKINIHKEIFLKQLAYREDYYDDSKVFSIDWRVPYSLGLLKFKLGNLEQHRKGMSAEMYDILKTHYIVGSLALLSENVAQKIALGRTELMPFAIAITNDSLMAPLRKIQRALVVDGDYNRYIQMAALIAEVNRTNRTIDLDFFKGKKQLQYYSIIENYVKGNVNRDYVLSSFIERSVMRVGLNDDMQVCADRFLNTTNQQSAYFVKIENIIKAEQAKKRNPMLPGFALADTSGTVVPLKKFEGKIVVLDFWFTGCNGCKDIKPYFERVERQFDNRKDIVFISVSIDKSRAGWTKDGIGRYSSATALQLYTAGLGSDHPIIKYLNFNSYPSIFVIGKNGEILLTRGNIPNLKTSDGERQFVNMLKKELSPNL